jgi:proteasome lid subunit RPN8/RPN11
MIIKLIYLTEINFIKEYCSFLNMNARTILTKQAFQGLFASAYGTLKVESSGFLAGERREKKTRREFVVELAQAAQKVKRTYQSVLMNLEEDKRLKYALRGIIGGFHSHSNGDTILSESDMDIIREFYPKGIEIIVSLDTAERLTRLVTTPFSVTGCFSDRGKKYRMGFCVHYVDFGESGERGHKRKSEIIIPKRVLKQYF